MVSTLQGFSLRFDVPAGGMHVRSQNGPLGLRALMQAGAQGVVEDLLRQAGLDRGAWKVLVSKGFTNPDPHIPLVSGVILDGRGVRVRFRPADRKGCGWMLLLLPPDMPDKDADRAALVQKVKAAALTVSGLTEETNARLDPKDPVIVALAVEHVKALPKTWKDFNLFVKAVADEAGPDEPFDYWKAALNEAANQGLLANGSNCYVVSNNPQALKVTEDMKQTTSPNGTHAPARDPIMSKTDPALALVSNAGPQVNAPLAKDPHLDDEALGLLTSGAESLMTHLEKMKRLGARRKELLVQLAQVQDELARNAQEIKAAASGVNLDNLALASGMLGS